jgi:acetyltransferase-like isoleucine patch superfamily enzyme
VRTQTVNTRFSSKWVRGRYWIGFPPTELFNTELGAIHVGRDAMFGEKVQELTGMHLAIWEAQRSGLPLHHVLAPDRDIRLGRGCYAGRGAILNGPLNIGNRAAIGAGSVVTHDVRARTFCAGAPARIRSHLGGPGENTL